jgi:KilA-N domain
LITNPIIKRLSVKKGKNTEGSITVKHILLKNQYEINKFVCFSIKTYFCQNWNFLKLKKQNIMAKSKTILVKGTEISIIQFENQDYISLSDMLKAKDGDFFISDWLRNRNTVEFLGIWERIYNPNFNYGEFAIIKSQAGLNSYKLSVKEWVEKTNGIGLKATAGRYGGTYAHKDIAFEFGMWINPEFKLYLIKEFQRLKDDENDRLKLTWNLQRTLAKVNYKIHTDAIKDNLIPEMLSKEQIHFIYANEADMLNVALFGLTAKQWRDANPQKPLVIFVMKRQLNN